jgi:hypothetical protein
VEFTSRTIPALLVAFAMIYTGVIWLLSRRVEIRMDSRVFAYTFILEGIVYALGFTALGDTSYIELRAFLSRLMVLMVCFSQALPLTVSYIRSILRNGKQSNSNTNHNNHSG